LDHLADQAAAGRGAEERRDRAWLNGVAYSNGNLVIRHLGIPTVTVPMGLMADIGMPVGPAYADSDLLGMASEFERAKPRRAVPPRAPASGCDLIRGPGRPWRDRSAAAPRVELAVDLEPMADDGRVTLAIRGRVEAAARVARLRVEGNGEPVEAERDGDSFSAFPSVPAEIHYRFHSRWRAPYGSLVLALAIDESGRAGAALAVTPGSPL